MSFFHFLSSMVGHVAHSLLQATGEDQGISDLPEIFPFAFGHSHLPDCIICTISTTSTSSNIWFRRCGHSSYGLLQHQHSICSYSHHPLKYGCYIRSRIINPALLSKPCASNILLQRRSSVSLLRCGGLGHVGLSNVRSNPSFASCEQD